MYEVEEILPPADAKEYIFPTQPSAFNPIVAIHHNKDLFQFELKDGQKSTLITNKKLNKVSITPQELYDAKVYKDYYNRVQLCVFHDETTFKGFYLCKTYKNFDSTSG